MNPDAPGGTGRPDPVEWQGESTPLKDLQPGAPLVRGGQLLIGTRDASWVLRPEVYKLKAAHAAVVSHTIAVAGGMAGVAGACSPTRLLLDDFILSPAAEMPADGLCQRPTCQKLFAEFAAAAADAGEPHP